MNALRISAEGGGSAVPLRVCTICDGVDAVMRLASWLVHLPVSADRVDLELSDALSWLVNEPVERFDILVIAPNAERSEATPRLIHAVLAEIGARAVLKLVLLPPGGRLSLKPQADLHILTGPPYPAPSMLQRDAAGQPQIVETPGPAAGRLARLIGFGTGARPAVKPADLPDPPVSLRLLAVQPMCGGAGATTVAIALAREIAAAAPGLRVCLMDLDLQFGGTTVALDLPAEPRVLEVYRNPRAADADVFQLCLREISENLKVFPAPAEILPPDALSGLDLQYLLGFAKDCADLVVLDLPFMVGDWNEAAYLAADRLYALTRLDVRSASNIRRLRDLVGSQVLPAQKFAAVVNMAPARPRKDWADRVDGFEKGLGQKLHLQLPDGGPQVAICTDSGEALLRLDPANPFRLALRDHAREIAELVPRLRRKTGEPV